MEPSLRNISGTALWVALYRARETARADAVFRDPLAAKLAGARGGEIAAGMTFSQKHEWAFVARTYLIDEFVHQQVVQRGVRMVVNLAAGLDTRPYRMQLPAALKWVEVDLPELLDYKEEILRDDKPVCQLERIRLDLADVAARRELFARLGEQAQKVLVLTEGLLIYLSADEVASLAADLAMPASFRYWLIDLVSPGLLKMLQKGMGEKLDAAGAAEIWPGGRTGVFSSLRLEESASRIDFENGRAAASAFFLDTPGRAAAGIQRPPRRPPLVRNLLDAAERRKK